MKTFQRFLRESHDLLPGTIIIVASGTGFNRRTQYGVTDGRVVYKVHDLIQKGHEFVGTPTDEVLDINGLQMEVLLNGLRHGDIVQSSLQLLGLPIGAEIIPTTELSIKNQYKKVSVLKWIQIGGTSQKFDTFHFAVVLKYKWVK